MKSTKKGIYKALLLGFVILTPSLQASEASPNSLIFGSTSPGVYVITTASEPHLSNQQNSLNQNNFNDVLIRQRLSHSYAYESVYSYAIASSNSFISSHYKIIAIIKDLL
ncbi:MAG: hypothetical protein CTY33_10465 [Methylotenera sp.]|nr:MAG: hypothetical protein CTY33_10465 [Methylotenera sp.]